ncbi:hypothetical protein COO60DRAFT_1501728 [Scenedesmus sp. NREL 46B-D3]|nr:hypothetical protein COO60DRAFT_1501728 [Scenedesmus sp. NREL 46B-D3]
MVLLCVHLLLLVCSKVCHGIPARLLLVLLRDVATHVGTISTLIHGLLCLGCDGTSVGCQHVALVVRRMLSCCHELRHASQRLLRHNSKGGAAAAGATCCRCSHAVVPAQVAHHHLLLLRGHQDGGQAWEAGV